MELDPRFTPPGYEPIVIKTADDLKTACAGREIWQNDNGIRIFNIWNADGSPTKQFEGYVVYVKIKEQE